MSQKGFNIPTTNFTDVQSWAKTVVDSLIDLRNGKTTNTGDLTLVANTASTVVSLPPGRLGTDSYIGLQPKTSNAAQEYGSGNIFESSRDVENRTFTLSHTSNGQTDRIFKYIIVG